MFEFSGLAGFSMKNVISRHGLLPVTLPEVLPKWPLQRPCMSLFVKSFATMECRGLFHGVPEAIVRGSSSSRRCSSRRNATGGQCDVQSFGVTPAGWCLYNQFVSISSFDCYPSRKGDAKSSLEKVSL